MPSRLLLKPSSMVSALLVSTVIVLTGCGGTPSSVSSPTSTATRTSPPVTTTAPAPSPTRHADVAAAVAAALSLYTRSPLNLNDPSAGYVWGSAVSDPNLPFSTRVRERMNWLQRQGYFLDLSGCGEDYMVGNQVGLFRAPKAVSATASPDGTVTVVIRGFMGSGYRDLTVVMSQINGTWLATDLRRGTGPNASIFSAHPNC